MSLKIQKVALLGNYPHYAVESIYCLSILNLHK